MNYMKHTLACAIVALAVTGLVHYVVVDTLRPRGSGWYFSDVGKAELRPVVLPFGVGSGKVTPAINDKNLIGVRTSRNVGSVWSAHGLPRGIRAYNFGRIRAYWENFLFPLLPEGVDFLLPGDNARPSINVGCMGNWSLSSILHQDSNSALSIWEAKGLKTKPRAIFSQEYFPSLNVRCQRSTGLGFGLTGQFVCIRSLFVQFSQLLSVKTDQLIGLPARILHFRELPTHYSKLPVVDNRYGEANENRSSFKKFLPKWRLIGSAMASFFVALWGWSRLRDGRNVSWGFIAFFCRCILWVYTVSLWLQLFP